MSSLSRISPIRAGALIIALLFSTFYGVAAQAALVSADSLVAEQLDVAQRADIQAFFEQQHARDALTKLGVDPAQVDTRLAQMTTSELQQLQTQIESMQAGGASAVGVVLLIFFVLIVLDLLGTTDIFPAIQPAN